MKNIILQAIKTVPHEKGFYFRPSWEAGVAAVQKCQEVLCFRLRKV